MSAPLTRTLAALEAGIEAGLHSGGQLYVSCAGSVVADLSFGEARQSQPMKREHLNIWLSSGKPVTAVAIAQLWERGALGLDDAVALHIPEFGVRGKEAISIRHLLTHTAGIRLLNLGWPKASWEEIVARICEMKMEPGWVPGQRAAYHLGSSWFLLGELVQRLDGRTFSHYVREEIFEPLGMVDSWIGMPLERHRTYGERLAPMFNTESRSVASHGWESEDRVTRPSPGGNAWGPIRELGLFYEALLAGGRAGDGRRILSAQTVEAITARHRVGLMDRTFRARLDWGLGVILDSSHYGESKVPYGYGPHASARTFGHSGYRSSTGFADPPNELVVALMVNGTPSENAHRDRFESVLGALYEDLGLEEKGRER